MSSFLALQELTADELNDALTSIKMLASTQTVNNTTTYVNITGLSFAVDASTKYFYFGHFPYTSGTTPDIKFKVNQPSAAANHYSTFLGFNTSATFTCSVFITETAAGGTGGDVSATIWGIADIGVTGGNMTFQFAQNTANASNTSVYDGAYAMVIKVG